MEPHASPWLTSIKARAAKKEKAVAGDRGRIFANENGDAGLALYAPLAVARRSVARVRRRAADRLSA
jgi:hypothetical protein